MSKLIYSTDQMGNSIQLPESPKRIVSLVPSQTEFLFDIGLDEEIVGVTRFCIHPADKTKGKEKIGGTKRFDMQKIKALNPDLIIGNKEENYEEGIEELRKDYPVWMSDIYTLEDAYAMMNEVAKITGRSEEGEKLLSEIQTRFKNWQPLQPGLSAAYFIWRKPYMPVGGNTLSTIC